MTGKVVIGHVGSLAHGANPAKYVRHATGLPASVFPQHMFSVIWHRPVLSAGVVVRHGGVPSALRASGSIEVAACGAGPDAVPRTLRTGSGYRPGEGVGFARSGVPILGIASSAETVF